MIMSKICGVILAGGKGTRLYPCTKVISKQLLPVYDKPLIYYPLSTLMKAGIRDIIVIAADDMNMNLFKNLLCDGSQYGITLEYIVQSKPRGIADAFLVAEKFINGRSVCLALGDNIFYSNVLDEVFRKSVCIFDNGWFGEGLGNAIFGCEVANPSAYGVAKFVQGQISSVVEKPEIPPSNWAVPGLYFFDNTVCERVKSQKPSARGELEITDLSNSYIADGQIKFVKLPGATWFDAGTHKGMLEASQFVHAVQTRTGEIIGDLEGIARNNGWI
jgi:glucose-1-phosphate thymidylyltransferase